MKKLLRLDGKDLIFEENGVKIGEIFAKEDGFCDFWPEEGNNGYWSYWLLEEIVELLKELNEPWEKQIEEYFRDV